MKRKQWSKLIATVTATAMAFAGVVGNPESLLQVSAENEGITYVDDEALDAALNSSGEVLTFTRNAVHDPSVVVDGDTYYVFGSHMGVSKTTDLRNWTSVTSESESSTLFGTTVSGSDAVTQVSYNEAFRNNAYTGKVTILVDGVETEVDFGTYDASAWNTAVNSYNVQGNMWAPDVIYNETMGKWCMYLSLNGAKWNSSIILLTADQVEGPYVYQGPVIYSGFNGTNPMDPMDTDLDLVYPEMVSTGDAPSKYNVGESWGTYWPHAIDPCVSYDEDGDLYLIYGSWSGGIYAIELDENTGLRDYTVVYESSDTANAAVTSDAYFGKKIAGGAYVSGEGAYVEQIGDYWYLFMSYGFYSPDGGYEMRIFRSENIDGPYVDATGDSAIFPSYKMNYGVNGVTNGEKLMGGYQWQTMEIGEIAQGHNSAFVDDDGNAYVVYHTKFNDGTVSHALRVHQLYVNEAGWLVAAPYEYTGETVNDATLASTTFETAEIAGDYQVIVHKYGMNYANMEIVYPETISLSEDGTVTGAYTGTWEVTKGSYVNVTLNDTLYQGVLVKQLVDGTANNVLTFTAKSEAGVSLWGSKNVGDEMAIALTRDSLGLANANNIFPVSGQIYQNVTLPTTGIQDAVVTWTSSNTDVLSDEGVVTVPAEDTVVTMTCTISKGTTAYEKAFQVTVMGLSSRNGDINTGLVAKYEFEGDFADSLSDTVGTATAQASGTAPSIKTDKDLGSQVAQVNFGYDGASSSNYVEIPNPLKGSETGAATISMQVKRSDSDVWDALWGFMDLDNTDGVEGRFYLTGNAYVGFNGTGGWFDANHSETVTNAIPVGEWSLVTVAVDGEGFDIYIDGALAYSEAYTKAFGSGNGFEDYASVTNLVASTDTFYLGYGSWWGSAPFRADDLSFYDRAFTAADASALYEAFVEKMTPAEDGEDTTSSRTYTELEQYQTYYNDFEEGLGDATVVGSGEIETVEDEKFGSVYHNATGDAGVRTNYLLLPSDTIANAATTGSEEMSIGFWVNVADAENYFYSPIFTAYGAEPNADTGNSWPMLALQSRLLAQVNCAGWTDFTAAENVAGVNQESTDWLADGEWHYYTATVTQDTVTVYVDGKVMNQWSLSGSDGSTVAGLFSNGADLDYVCLGGNQAWTWADNDASYMFDKVSLYSTALTADEVVTVMNEVGKARSYKELQGYQTYYNDFEDGLGGATVVGSGEVETVEEEAFGSVYHNATGEAGVRTNYLLLPSDTIANAATTGSEEMTIGFWVNVADAENYFYSPIFTAYGDAPNADTGNSWPMMALQSRLLAQVNCAGWTDFTAVENVEGANQESTAWLDDKEWHYYTATFTQELVTVYVDGEVMNQWALEGTDGNTVAGVFSNGSELDYVCLGGNQAWTWADNDASYMFDKVALFSTALTQDEISKVMAAEGPETEEPEATPEPTEAPEPTATPVPREDRTYEEVEGFKTYFNDFENGYGTTIQIGSGALEASEDATFGTVYHNATANAGVRTNYLLLPSDTIANAVAAGNEELSIGFWVNVADATGYYWTPLFTAYGAAPTDTGNTWPMMALQSRLLGQVNCAGYADFTAAQNVAGANLESTVWLDDAQWHYYTATFTKNTAAVYVDGELQNQWTFDGTDGNCISGIFTAGNELTYVSLGGNQAWDWADNDSSYMFDDVAVYSTVLSAAEIADVMEAKAEAAPEATVAPTATPEPTVAPTEAPTATPEPTIAPTEAPTEAPAPSEEPEEEENVVEDIVKETVNAVEDIVNSESVEEAVEVVVTYVKKVTNLFKKLFGWW